MSETLRITAAQLNFTVGDMDGNAQKIIAAAIEARDKQHADLIVFPELALCGYPPEDLLFRNDFHQQNEQALQKIQTQVSGIDIILGHPQRVADKIYNAASLIRDGQIILTYHKQCLPNYGVFDEKRYFEHGEPNGIFIVKNIPVAIIICEDIWFAGPVNKAVKAGAELIICINASPLDVEKPFEREREMRERIDESATPILYVHGVSGQDDLVFDGGSLVMDAQGKICAHADYYQEKLFTVDFKIANKKLVPEKQPLPKEISLEERVYNALVLAVRDYVNKNNFPGILLGLSGGVDSGLTLAIAVDAIGKDRIHAIVMPSRYTTQLSLDLADEQAKLLAIKATVISIEPAFTAFLTTLTPEFAAYKPDITEENLQARCRGNILMALSNKTGKLVLTTGNKSELAVGYSTLYGDMAGGFDVLKDVPKTLVFRLSKYRNTLSPAIPQAVIDRPPSAELAPNQKDEDSLPPYAILDAILEMYVEHDKSSEEIIAKGFDAATVNRVVRLVDRSEYKRRQAPPGPRMTVRAFGRERRYPITSKFEHK